MVHGMARDLSQLEGALPANTLVSAPDFEFTWDAMEGAEYQVVLESRKYLGMKVQLLQPSVVFQHLFDLERTFVSADSVLD